jgi:hypothetical protein
MPEAQGVPLPTALLLGGAAAGIALSFLAKLVNGAGARRRSRAAARSLRKRLEASAQTLVLTPLEEELDAYARFCTAVGSAQASRPSTAPKRA